MVKLDGKNAAQRRKEWIEEKDMIEGWDDLVEKMKGQRKDMTMDDFLKKHFAADKFAELRNHIKAFVQGFDVADTREVSVQSLYKEWSNESDQFRIKTGYGALIGYLEKKCNEAGCKIFTGDAVRQIDWQKNEVTLYTSSGKKYYGNKIIITVPVSVLRDLLGKGIDKFHSACR
jgi:monoamine oxidase